MTDAAHTNGYEILDESDRSIPALPDELWRGRVVLDLGASELKSAMCCVALSGGTAVCFSWEPMRFESGARWRARYSLMSAAICRAWALYERARRTNTPTVPASPVQPDGSTPAASKREVLRRAAEGAGYAFTETTRAWLAHDRELDHRLNEHQAADVLLLLESVRKSDWSATASHALGLYEFDREHLQDESTHRHDNIDPHIDPQPKVALSTWDRHDPRKSRRLWGSRERIAAEAISILTCGRWEWTVYDPTVLGHSVLACGSECDTRDEAEALADAALALHPRTRGAFNGRVAGSPASEFEGRIKRR